jgi:hypothetical protein
LKADLSCMLLLDSFYGSEGFLESLKRQNNGNRFIRRKTKE